MLHCGRKLRERELNPSRFYSFRGKDPQLGNKRCTFLPIFVHCYSPFIRGVLLPPGLSPNVFFSVSLLLCLLWIGSV